MLNKDYIKQKNVDVWGPIRFYDEGGRGILLYEYVRGSHAYGLNTPESDQDRGGVFALPNDILFGMTSQKYIRGYVDQIKNKSQDDSWFELSRFAELLVESNPNILESLFLDDQFVLYEHPIITDLKKHRDDFITKRTFTKFNGMARSQIQKAHGLKKKIVSPVTERKSPLDFVYTFYKQGSTKIRNWLEYRGMFQELMGLVSIPNMHNVYGAYYDWASHLDRAGIRGALEKRASRGLETSEEAEKVGVFANVWYELTGGDVYDPVDLRNLLGEKPKRYSGIVGENSNELRLSSVPEKDAEPVTYIVYNQEGYTKHAQDYREYQQWVRERNPVRWSLNEGMTYDRKNMMHAFRLLHMSIEIASGHGMKIYRNEDREELLAIRNSELTYDKLIEQYKKLDEYKNNLQETSVIKDDIDVDALNGWVISARKSLAEEFLNYIH